MALRLLAHRRSPVTIESRLGPALGNRNVALFDPRMERSFESAVNRLRMQDLSLAALDLLVLRDSQRNAFDDIDGDDVLAAYLEDVPVLALCGSHDPNSPAPTLRAPSWAKPFAEQLEPAEFRGPEIEALLRRSTALHRHERCHYDLPSTAVHAAEFIRLANALQDATDLVRLADWVLPLLGDRYGLAADTGTLVGLLTVVRDEALRRFGWEVPIAALDEYPRGPDAVEALIDNFAVADWTRLVFLISVNSTGGVARDVARREPAAHIVALCETAIDGAERAEAAAEPGCATVFLEYPVERWTLDAQRRCERCDEFKVLHVHPETYEVTAQLQWTQRGFDSNRVESERPFWAVADRMDAVSLHVDHAMSTGSREEVRHLSISLDVALLLADEDFFARCHTVLKDRYPRPDVVLIPEHASAGALSRLAEATWDAPVFAVPLGSLKDAARDAVRDARDVLVMDDVVISAQTLFGLRAAIYDVAQEQQHDIRVWGFVVVARPSSADAWHRIKQRYMAATDDGMKRGLHAAQELLLPPPGVEACPWCRERVMLQRIMPALSGEAEAERLAGERETFLRRTPLLAPLGVGGVGADFRTEGSMVGDLRPYAAFAAAASLAQHLKDELHRRREVAEIPFFNVELLVSAVFDAAVFGGFLRTFDPLHVRDPTRESELADCLLGKSWSPGMLAELAIGASERKLPVDSVVRCIDEQSGDEHLAAMLRAVATRPRPA
jgi:hypothetical protein